MACGDVADAIADRGGGDRRVQGPFARVDDREVFVASRADDEGHGRVGHPSVHRSSEVERHEIPVPQRVVVRQPVEHGVVHGRADHLAERPRPERGVVVDVARLGARPADEVVSAVVDGQQVRAHGGLVAQRGEHLCHEPARRPHRLDLSGRAQLDHHLPSVVTILSATGAPVAGCCEDASSCMLALPTRIDRRTIEACGYVERSLAG